MYYQFKAVVRFLVLFDWVPGGTDGKVFGSWSWRTDRAQRRGTSAMTESQTFPIQLDLTRSISILSYDWWVENLENLFLLKKYAINWRVRDNHKNDSTIKTFPLFFRVRTGNSYFIEKRDIFFSISVQDCH